MTSADLWTEATRDIEAENRLRNLEMARHASQDIWAFLAQANDQWEFEDRMSLAQGRIGVIASQTGVSEEDLIKVFDQRFSLLLEAKGDFSSDDAPDDDKDDDGNPDNEQKDEEDSEESGEEKGSDSDDDSDDSDENSDDTGDGDDEDDDKDGSDKGDSDSSADQFFQQKSSARYASLMERIQAGENPLSWGGAAPFVSDPARRTAGIDDSAPVTDDSNVPQDPTANTDSGPGMGAAPLAETTKPRQLPDGGGGPNMLAGGEPLDPALNGGDIHAGSDADSPDGMQSSAKVRAIAAEVQVHNPHLSAMQCERVALQVVARYYKQAEDLSPLLYGDRGGVNDGPLTHQVKTWEPGGSGKDSGDGSSGGGSGNTTPALPGGGGDPALPAGGRLPALPSAGEGAAGAAGIGEGAASVGELLPLLAL